MIDRILYLTGGNLSAKMQNFIRGAVSKTGVISGQGLYFYSLTGKIKSIARVRDRLTESSRLEIQKHLRNLLKKFPASLVVINDVNVLEAVSGEDSLYNCRGSLYFLNNIPALVLDNPTQLFLNPVYPFLFKTWWTKAVRWIKGKQYNEPRLNYSICRSISDLQELRAEFTSALFISADIETGKDFITCISFTLVLLNGRLNTYVVPFFDPLDVTGCWWINEEDHIIAYNVVKEIIESEVWKCFQNGSFDAAWLIRFGIVPRGLVLDTMHLWRSLYVEAPKALEVIVSATCDTYRFWKNENKDEEDETKGGSRIPRTKEGYEKYLRYNALDSHYTSLSCVQLIRKITGYDIGGRKGKTIQWAVENYHTEMEAQFGPYFAMTMRGLRIDLDRKDHYRTAWETEALKELQELRIMVDDPTFNPNSNQQVAHILYDIFGAKMPALRGKGVKKNLDGTTKRSADEKILKFIRLQHPMIAWIIDKIQAVKKPLNNASKYGDLSLYKGRFLYLISLTTETWRTRSKQHHYWTGTNAQNIPGEVRDMFRADDGYILFDFDYKNCDSFFVAFESGDPKFMANVCGDKDLHSSHAAFFFQKKYEEIYERYKKKDPWATHPIHGVRQNTKRITHGAHYRMAGGTLYMVMGHEALMATADAMGYKDCHSWTIKKCGEFCQYLINNYIRKMYPGLGAWFEQSVHDARRNNNLVTVYGGKTRLFFADLAKDKAAQRKLSAFKGQGGTAGVINRTVVEAFYSEIEAGGGNLSSDFMLLLQVHDSLVGQCRLTKLDLLRKFLTIMQKPCIVNGREFSIPVDPEVGFSWKSGMITFNPNESDADIIKKALLKEKEVERRFLEAA